MGPRSFSTYGDCQPLGQTEGLSAQRAADRPAAGASAGSGGPRRTGALGPSPRILTRGLAWSFFRRADIKFSSLTPDT